MTQNFDVVIIGGGILGASISYFLSSLNKTKRIAVVEQARSVAFHTSGRNTGKVHAPYLYHPEKKRLSARSAFYGYGMWEQYAKLKNIPFRNDGVVEVALDVKDSKVLEKYYKWGMQNGLHEKDMKMMDGSDLKKTEPEIRCESALCVYRDASVDYTDLTNSIINDSKRNGTELLLDTRVTGIKQMQKGWKITLNGKQEITAKFLINAAGGQSVDIAHGVGAAKEFTDVHFRGEYWKVPAEYQKLTKSSVYAVPKFSQYPFLDPHWILRADCSCEIGPNAVPVFSPYGYDTMENVKKFIPKTLEMLSTCARKAIFNKEFQELALGEIRSSLSKTVMVNRVKKFLPGINADKITQKGTAGIRSSVINSDGMFVPDVIMTDAGPSFHILNYNSPGATGVLPFSAHVVGHLNDTGLFKNQVEDVQCGPWRFSEITDMLSG